MPYIPNEALTREQGEQIIDVLKGEEPKEYGYPYTNEVLNKEQGDRIIKAFKAFKDSIPTEGLPDPSTFSDGTAMVAVNGEWKTQEGYGWIEEGNFTAITWDGDTEGRDAIYVEAEGQRLEMYYKVSDSTFTRDSVLDGKVTMGGVDYNIRNANIVDNESDDYISSTAQFTAVMIETLAVISCNAPGIIRATDMGTTIEYPCLTTGIYFLSFANMGQNVYVSSLTYGTPSISHPIDHTLMPEGYGYYGEPAFERITWDGYTLGRAALTVNGEVVAYKVSDTILTAEMLNGASSTANTGNIGGVEVIDDSTGFLFADTLADNNSSIYSGAAGEYSGEGGTVVIPLDGTYFTKASGDYIASLTAPPARKFDPALIPSIVPAAPSEAGAYVLTCTVTGGEAVYSWKSSE